jgi:hypothetical protein
MNIQPSAGTPGNLTPIWMPPLEIRWIITVLIVFMGSVANRLPIQVLNVFTSPIGFFLTALLGIGSYKYGFKPGAFAIFFFLLLAWSTKKSKYAEGFLSASNTVDWVTNSQRWFVEKTLKERPLGIQEKDVKTFPIQGSSSQSNNSNGNT